MIRKIRNWLASFVIRFILRFKLENEFTTEELRKFDSYIEEVKK
jgi:hypothetical protein